MSSSSSRLTSKKSKQTPPPIPLPHLFSLPDARLLLKPVSNRIHPPAQKLCNSSNNFSVIKSHSQPIPADEVQPTLSAHVDSESTRPMEEPLDQNQDCVQPWQSQLAPTSSTLNKKGPLSSISDYHSSLERANSAAARLDSLARLNGVKTPPTLNETQPVEENDNDLPAFLRVAHLQDISNKKNIITSPSALLNQPINLGFGVGPNGRGVPRLSALQRKAIEKMNNKELGGVTLLSRSHTTTGTERTPRLDISALRARGRFIKPDSSEKDNNNNHSSEREQARSNLIRKLSNRGGLRQKPEHDITLDIPGIPKSRPRSGSLNDAKPPVSTPDWSLSPPISSRQAENMEVSMQVDDSNTFAVHSVDCSPSSQSFTFKGAPQDTVSDLHQQNGAKVFEKTPHGHHMDRNNSTSSSIRTTTTFTNRASSSGVSNFTLNSEFRSYRHSIERDRDSVLDRMGLLDNTLDNEFASEVAAPNGPTGAVSGDVSDHSSSCETDKPDLMGRRDKRPVESLPPFNRMLEYRDGDPSLDQLGLSSHIEPHAAGSAFWPAATPSLLASSTTPPVQPLKTGHHELIVHQTTTTTISGGDFSTTIPGKDVQLFGPTSSMADVERFPSIESSRIMDDNSVVLSPAPALPEKLIRNDANHLDSCLTDYKFPSNPRLKTSPSPVFETRVVVEPSVTTGSPHPSTLVTVASPWVEECCGSTSPAAPLHISHKQSLTDTYQDQVNRAVEQMNRGSIASSQSTGLSNSDEPVSNTPHQRRRSPSQLNYQTDKSRPQRPSNPPPIGQAHRKLSRSPPTALQSHSHVHGPSQFPPAANMKTSHLPPASASDLARYNDHKLAPFPALLSCPPASSTQPGVSAGLHSTPISHSNSASSSVNLTPTTVLTSPSSMSTGPSDTSIKSPRSSQASKPPRSHGNSILSTATSFFSSNIANNRARAGSASSSISVGLIGSPRLIDSTNSNFGHCPSGGSVGRIMSPSLSLSGATTYDSEEHVEEIDHEKRSSGAQYHLSRGSSPIFPKNSHSAVPSQGFGLVSRPSSTKHHQTPIAVRSPSLGLAPKNSILSRSTTSRSSLSSSSAASYEHRQCILSQLKPFLNLADLTRPNLSKRPSILDQPPRKLRLHGPVLQVVNSTSVKDRYLFLFNDILVIAKPIIEFEDNLSEEGERIPKLPITLKNQFLVKSVVELGKLECATPRLDTLAINGHVALCEPTTADATSAGGKEDPVKMAVQSKALLDEFIARFARDPFSTVNDTVQRGLVKGDHSSIAKVLFMTTQLEKKQLGIFLCSVSNIKILKAYIDRFKFHHCRIDDALRLLFLSLRLPNDVEDVERLLSCFASQWVAVNEQVGIDVTLAIKISKAILGLNDALHSSLYDSTKYVTQTFRLPVGMASCVENFVEGLKIQRDHLSSRTGDSGQENRTSSIKFTIHHEEKLISEEKLALLLTKIYSAVQRDKIVQAKATEEETERILISNGVASLDPEGGGLLDTFPNRLTYQIKSELITFTLPQVDPHFAIKLFSSGLKFEPHFLTFSKSRSASFRILGRSLGLCNINFIKIGSHASRYIGLPLAKTVLVERAFMKDTLQVTFQNHLRASRKYLFSFDKPEQREELVEFVSHAQSQLSLQLKARSSTAGATTGGAVAQAAALQVLRDTLIPNEEFLPLTANPHTQTTINLTRLKQPSSSSSKPSSTIKPCTISNNNPNSANHRIRSNSLSETYIFGIGFAEKALQNAIVQKRALAQELQIKKNQQKLLALSLRQNIEGGRAGLNPYSISKAEEIKRKIKEGLINNQQQHNNQNHSIDGNNHNDHRHQDNSKNGGGSGSSDIINNLGKTVTGGGGGGGIIIKDELDLFLERFWRCGEDLITQCEQNSLIPLVLGFLSKGVVIDHQHHQHPN